MSIKCVAANLALLFSATIPVPAAGASHSESLVAKNYPRDSLTRGEQGIVKFAVELDSDARIDSCVVTKSSGYRELDRATCDLIVRHAEFPPAQADGKRVATIRNGQIRWTLPEPYRDNAKRAPAPIPASLTELESERLICERNRAIGSLIKTTTYCLTKAEWAIARIEGRRQVERVINPSHQNHGCHLVGPRCN